MKPTTMYLYASTDKFDPGSFFVHPEHVVWFDSTAREVRRVGHLVVPGSILKQLISVTRPGFDYPAYYIL